MLIELNAEPVDGFNAVWITALVFGHTHAMTKEESMKRLGELGLPARPFFYPRSSLPAIISNEKIRRVLKWQAKVDLHTGLERTREYFKDRLEPYFR